ncbi:uncharacterized protein LOC123320320 [Coccinella septempunctata]|uniref:uncharacterized protein LOC123320320 n=1 Tax=Coccinella septempunctata TaxID=41139 RepID=UPI001D08DED6|nr:uncharacterized protein LOC123320320 [Coccinella septempunctata]
MNFDLALLLTMSMVLMTLGQKDKGTDNGSTFQKSMDEILSTFSTQIMPIVGAKKSTLVKIIDEHRKPLKDNLEELREKMNERIMAIGFEVLEKGLDFAEILQNMTSKIKKDVLHLKK